MIKLARLDNKNRVVEFIEMEDPRASLHPNVLKQCVDANDKCQIGDFYDKQRFTTPTQEQVDEIYLSDDQKQENRTSEIKRKAIENLKNLEVEKIGNKIIEDALKNLIQFVTGEEQKS